MITSTTIPGIAQQCFDDDGSVATDHGPHVAVVTVRNQE